MNTRQLADSCTPVANYLTDRLESILGGELIGIYAYGSAVVGPFLEGVSDLDLIVVTRRAADLLDLDGLDEMHAAAVGLDRQWADRLELVYVATEALAAAGASAHRVAVVSPGEPFHLTGPAGDWLMNWYLVRESGIALAGAPPTTVFPPIEWDEFAAAVVGYVAYLASATSVESRPGSLAYSVLSATRALRTVETGRPCSKAEGAEYGRRRLPRFAWLIDEAEACRSARGSVGFDRVASRAAALELIRTVTRQLPTGKSGPD